MELSKFLQQQGFGSRKACRQAILAGEVSINGARVDEPAAEVDPDSVNELLVNGLAWRPLRMPAYLLMHKPAGYEVSHNPLHHRSVFGLFPEPLRHVGHHEPDC